MAEEKIIYEKHPVSPERKQELREKGYTIIDERFRPSSSDAQASESDKQDSRTKRNTPPAKQETPAKQ